MKKINIILISIFLFISFITAEDILKIADDLDHKGKYKESLDFLKDNFDTKNPDIKISWRIGRETFELSNNTNDKNKKIEYFEEGINYTEPYLKITDAANRDRSEIIHWYAINYASKIKALGIFGGRESLTIVPAIFELMDRCTEIDPTYAGAYFFKAKLQEEVPFFLGGDKLNMTENYSLALKYANKKERLLFLVDIAKALYKRNWDVEKKISQANKKGISQADVAFADHDDIYYAKKFLSEAEKLYKEKEEPSDRDKKLYTEILELTKEYSK